MGDFHVYMVHKYYQMSVFNIVDKIIYQASYWVLKLNQHRACIKNSINTKIKVKNQTQPQHHYQYQHQKDSMSLYKSVSQHL